MTSPNETPPAPVVPRRAATVILLRDAEAGLEVLMLRRVERTTDRHSGAFVFPGGTLDAADATLHDCCAGLDDALASQRLGLPRGGLDYFVAAIRESFEEAGVLLAVDSEGRPAEVLDGTRVDDLRNRLRSGELDVAAMCRLLGVKLAADSLGYFSHWITPAGLPKRFDTRFFVAALPPGQTASHCNDETLEHRWISPREALERATELKLPNPTRVTLETIASFDRASECIEHVRSLRDIEVTQPVLADGPKGVRAVMPTEPAYAELRRIDPHGRTPGRYVIEPGRCVQLSPRVLRVTAPNPGFMTGPGTNTYLVGDPQGEGWAVIDPGPDSEPHVDAILAAAPGPIRWILVTHTHRDHSPAARALKERCGARCIGIAAPPIETQDATWQPESPLAHGDTLSLGPQTTLRVVHTPGHASNHFCYVLQEERTLFSGDHVMQGSTVVINPPDGDMGAYMMSLRALLNEDLEWIAPGHGFLIARPHAAIERLIAHRLAREAKVLRAVAAGVHDVDAMLPLVYDDVPVNRYAWARRSLLAHLVHLRAEGRA